MTKKLHSKEWFFPAVLHDFRDNIPAGNSAKKKETIFTHASSEFKTLMSMSGSGKRYPQMEPVSYYEWLYYYKEISYP